MTGQEDAKVGVLFTLQSPDNARSAQNAEAAAS